MVAQRGIERLLIHARGTRSSYRHFFVTVNRTEECAHCIVTKVGRIVVGSDTILRPNQRLVWCTTRKVDGSESKRRCGSELVFRFRPS
jgi:hypothetical protein